MKGNLFQPETGETIGTRDMSDPNFIISQYPFNLLRSGIF